MKAVVGLCLAAFLSQAAAEPYGPYHANVLRVIDGDSIEVDVRLWPGLTQRTSVRVKGIDTPERTGPACEKALAEAAKKFTREWVSLAGLRVVLTDVSNDKFGGRVVGKMSREGSTKDLGQALLLAGHARPYWNGKKVKWCG